MNRDHPFVVNILGDLNAMTTHSKFELISKIWPNAALSGPAFRESEYMAFLAHLNQEFSHLKQEQSEVAAESVQGIIELISLLRNNLSEGRNKIAQEFRDRFPDLDDFTLSRTMELVVRLWLTTRVALNEGFPKPIQTAFGSLEWPAEISLREAVHSQFALVDPADNVDKYFSPGLDPSLTASALVDICGIKLAWTSNLMDHLRLDKRHRVLTVYEHKICLLNHIKGDDSPFPLGFLQETIDTLNLLFPFGHGPTRELLRRENKLALYGLGTCNRDRRLSFGDYRVWRVQMASIVDVFNEPPRNWWQLLSDRRNLREWATFWLGPMVLILTIVSIVTGTVSSVYAVKQYNLACAQACAACAM
ncbi:hypothetical protein SLS60_005100 [Paraconiothyrium brasiliense]|uniref:Uncharacterized protein n=1 Tax=Paraconiothyrium brasiliense TaxID=300254 RepID=A0ABR3RGV0_9PLEO